MGDPAAITIFAAGKLAKEIGEAQAEICRELDSLTSAVDRLAARK